MSYRGGFLGVMLPWCLTVRTTTTTGWWYRAAASAAGDGATPETVRHMNHSGLDQSIVRHEEEATTRRVLV